MIEKYLKPSYVCYLLYGLSLVAAITLLWQGQEFFVDDSYISFRYIHNALAGHGLVYNPGERVEGYTHFLFLMVNLGLHALGIELLYATRLVNGMAALITLFLLCRHIHHRLPHGPFLAALSCFLLASSYPYIIWVQGGLEPAFLGLWVTSGALLLLSFFEPQQQRHDQARLRILFYAGTCFALAALTRLDSLLCGGVGGIVLCFYLQEGRRSRIDRERRRSTFKRAPATHSKPAPAALHQRLLCLGTYALPFVLLVGAHFLWRHYYYGEWLPNTYYAKLYALPLLPRIIQGYHYLAGFLMAPPYLFLWVLICIPFAFLASPQRVGNSFLALLFLSYLGYILYAGGDWMPLFRLIAPFLPLMLLFSVRILAPRLRTLTPSALAITLPAILLMSYSQSASPQLAHALLGRARYSWDAIAYYIKNNWPENSLIAINMAGYIPYLTPGYRYLDMLGINDKTIAHRNDTPLWRSENGTAGHNKGDGRYVLSRHPGYILTGSGFENTTMERSFYVSEREMLAEEGFRKHYILRQVPLTIPLSASAQEILGKPSIQGTLTFYQRKGARD